MMYGYGYYDYYPFHILGGLFMAIFWIFVIILLIRLLRRNRGHMHGHRHGLWCDCDGRNALDIARERYAKGELTREQFEQMKKDLE